MLVLFGSLITIQQSPIAIEQPKLWILFFIVGILLLSSLFLFNWSPTICFGPSRRVASFEHHLFLIHGRHREQRRAHCGPTSYNYTRIVCIIESSRFKFQLHEFEETLLVSFVSELNPTQSSRSLRASLVCPILLPNECTLVPRVNDTSRTDLVHGPCYDTLLVWDVGATLSQLKISTSSYHFNFVDFYQQQAGAAEGHYHCDKFQGSFVADENNNHNISDLDADGNVLKQQLRSLLHVGTLYGIKLIVKAHGCISAVYILPAQFFEYLPDKLLGWLNQVWMFCESSTTSNLFTTLSRSLFFGYDLRSLMQAFFAREGVTVWLVESTNLANTRHFMQT